MGLRRLLGCLLVTLVLCACGKDKDEPGKGMVGSGKAGLDQRCVKLATVCGDTEAHVEKILADCQNAASTIPPACADPANAVYDCYEEELCGKGDKVWALDDLRVLADRHKKCVAERAGRRECVEANKGGAR